jgi:GT2 family glycosyltransferase
MTDVDVIIPCYNYGHFLPTCLQSVLCQQGVKVQILIIDDASTDNSGDIAAAIAEQDDRVKLLRHSINEGHISTYNDGLAWASAKYTILLSADDMLTPGSLSRATGVMEDHSDVGFAYGPVIRTQSPELELPGAEGDDRCWTISGIDYIRRLCATGENVVATPAAVVRTSVQKKIGGYRKELPHAGDMEMWLRFAAVSTVGYVNKVQAYYRMHGQNMSSRYENLRDFHQRVEVFRIFFEHYGHSVCEATELRDMAFQTLSREALDAASDAFDDRNLEQCEDLIKCAAALAPNIRLSTRWKRLKYKRLIGWTLWSAVRPFARRVNKLVRDQAIRSRVRAMPQSPSLRTPFECATIEGVCSGSRGSVGPGEVPRRK